MTSFEEEYKKQLPTIKRLSFIALLGKRVIVKGEENFIKKGPNILVGNHIGSFKDIATLAKIAPRPIFFTANKMIFTKDEFNFLIRKHAQRHLKEFGLFLDLVLTPIKSIFVNYISTYVGKVGMIPVDMYGGKSLAIKQCQNHLKEGRLIVTLQGRGRVEKKGPNPYVREFKRGASIICYNLFQVGISVPVTPLAIFGTHFPFLIPTKVRVNVGEPMYIKDYLAKNFSETIERFRIAQQERVKSLLREIIRT